MNGQRKRRFYAGWEATVSGIQFRVVEGKKKSRCPGEVDLRLDWWVNGAWEPVTLDVVFLVVDMVAENEDVLYPFPQLGGEKVLKAVTHARRSGWQKAVAKLHGERQGRQERDEQTFYGEGDAHDYDEGAA